MRSPDATTRQHATQPQSEDYNWLGSEGFKRTRFSDHMARDCEVSPETEMDAAAPSITASAPLQAVLVVLAVALGWQ